MTACVNVCACIRAQGHVYVQVLYACMSVCVYTSIPECVCVCVCVCISVYGCVRISMHECVSIST